MELGGYCQRGPAEGQSQDYPCLRSHRTLPSHASTSSQTHRTPPLPSRASRVRTVRRTPKKASPASHFNQSLPHPPPPPRPELCPYLSDPEVRIPVGIQPGEQSKTAAAHSQTCAEPRRHWALGLISGTHSPGCVLTLSCPTHAAITAGRPVLLY